MAKNQLAYLELPSANVSALKQFYGTLFGWTYEDFGPDYAAVHGAGLDAGFNGDPASKPKAPLAIVEPTEIELMQEKVRNAGGTITMPIFAYPGGRRFISPTRTETNLPSCKMAKRTAWSLTRPGRLMVFLRGTWWEPVAQLVEHRPFKALVLGSSPSGLTISLFIPENLPGDRSRGPDFLRPRG